MDTPDWLPELADLLRDQDGVVARQQLRRIGLVDHDVRRLVRRRELVVVHLGVYVNHTGELSWQQRAQAAVHAHWPAALTRESALPDPAPRAPIQVAIDVRRTVQPVDGVVAHRTADFADRVLWLRSPPRIALEHAVIDVAVDADDELRAFRVLAEACRSRETTASRILATLGRRGRVPGRKVLHDLLTDLSEGSCSVLERAYLRRVERPHGLPTGVRQPRADVNGRSVYRDVDYRPYRTCIELDGRAFHDTALARDRDAERDLVAAVEGDAVTVRLTYGLVFGSPCRTAERIAALLMRRGWPGPFVPCPECPAQRTR